MKVLSINHTLPIKNTAKQNPRQKQETPSFSSFATQNTYNPTFGGLSPKYLSAKAYLRDLKAANGNLDKYRTDIYSLDLNRLDGIQEGIKVFNGLNIKEIAFIATTLMSIATKRGCRNVCSHCYAEAKPPIKEREDTINKMKWEDFTSLTNGLEELNNRLGFYITEPGARRWLIDQRYVIPFHDADCSDLVLKDKKGTEHDFIDIANRIYRATGLPLVFDTSGWFPNDTSAQKRVERIIEHFSNEENCNKIYQFNLSFNPFHSSYTKSVFEKRLGHFESSEKLRDFYTSRIANALFTLTPLIKNQKFSIINRAIVNNKFEGSEGFENEDLKDLASEILDKLKILYEEDLKNEQKYIQNESQIPQYLQILGNKMMLGVTDFSEVGRAIETFGKDNPHYDRAEKKRARHRNTVKNANSSQDITKQLFSGIIDSNGNYYLTTFWNTFPTELKLNFTNNNKKTAPIGPLLEEDLVITKNIINSTQNI